MATSSWRSALNSHPIFDVLRGEEGAGDIETNSQELLAVNDSDLFIWDQFKVNLLTTNLKNLLEPDSDKSRSHQTLLCNNPPLFKVNRIEINSTGCQIALVGDHGVSVLELPQRWGKYADFEGGKKRISCRTTTVAERFFTTHQSVCLLQASWHPGSKTDSHLIVLTSDNLLRVYDINDAQNIYQIYPLGETPSNSCLLSTFEEVLGDIAVSFDFGEPIEAPPANLESTRLNLKDQQSSDVYPVYILRGNGDVYYLTLSVEEQSSAGNAIQGPLAMYPPAEDNYGLDACSLLCLHTNPPVLAMATSSGSVYHSIVLSKGVDDETQSWSDDRSYKQEPEMSLYVYEKVELELSLSLEDEDDDAPCPISLHRDPVTTDRYHCSHRAGVHSILVTWLNRLEEICCSEDDTAIQEFSQDQSCIAEHVVCTKPTSSSVPEPIHGLCIVSDKLLGVTLICLTSSINCLALPLANVHSVSSSLLSSSKPLQPRSGMSPLGKLHPEPFDKHIKKILQRKTSNPVLRSHPKTEVTQQEFLQILSRATQIFREEYILKQETAREEIAKRVQVLRDQKEQQLVELRDFEQEREEIQEKAERIADKLEGARDFQEQLLHRIESMSRSLETRLPMLSDAEKNMKKELSTIGEKLKHLKNSLQQVRMKKDFQERQMTQSESASKASSMTPTQIKHVKTILKEEGDKIGSLVKEVNTLKSIAGD
ncbi:nucleoporin 88-like [Ptychodera flava]|uniref:nucleoporin 88-like n=1 Tax=Ptychodera flava TaxID=63121 RepID=UPI00396A42D1